MKFAKVLSRSGQSLLAARARDIANTVKQEQFNRCPFLLGL